MRYLFALTVLAGWTSAHSLITHFHVNGAADSSCVRRAVSTNPITDLSSDAMACNVVSSNAANKCTVQAGDVVGFEWRVDPNIPAAEYPANSEGQRVGVTDTTHKGPCAVYAKKVSDSITATAPGDGWFKIMEDGLDQKGVFCTTRLREADALQEVTIPSTIEAGDYLLRAEFLTLNDAAPKSTGGKETPQFYPGCAQVTIMGTTGTAEPATVKIPGYVDITSPGLIFDVRSKETFEDYPMPGPALFADGTSPAPAYSVPTTLTKSNTTSYSSNSNFTSETPLPVTKTYTTSYFSIYTSFASELTSSVKATRTYSTTYFSIYTSFAKGAQNPNVDPTPIPAPATNGTTYASTTYAKTTTKYAPTVTPTPTVVTLVTATRPTTKPITYTGGATAVPTRTADAYCGKWCRYFEAKKNKAAKQKSKEAAKQKSKAAKQEAKAAKQKAKAAKLKLKKESKALKKYKKSEKKGRD